MSDNNLMTVLSLHDQFSYVLTADAVTAINPEILKSERTEIGPDGKPVVVAKAIFLTAKARSDEGVRKAAEALYSQVNILAARGLVLGHLCKLSKLRVLAQPVTWGAPFIDIKSMPTDWAVFVFPVVPVTADPEWFGPFWTQEGGAGSVTFD